MRCPIQCITAKWCYCLDICMRASHPLMSHTVITAICVQTKQARLYLYQTHTTYSDLSRCAYMKMICFAVTSHGVKCCVLVSRKQLAHSVQVSQKRNNSGLDMQ